MITIAPFAVMGMLVVWFAKLMKSHYAHVARSHQHMERVEALLERIANAMDEKGT